MLDSLPQAVLLAISNPTHGTYVGTDETALHRELDRMGRMPRDGVPYRLLQKLSKQGYIDAIFLGGMRVAELELTPRGRAEIESVDPFERVHTEARRAIASEGFAAACPDAFAPWADAERLLWEDDVASQLTTIGHKVREATQRSQRPS